MTKTINSSSSSGKRKWNSVKNKLKVVSALRGGRGKKLSNTTKTIVCTSSINDPFYYRQQRWRLNQQPMTRPPRGNYRDWRDNEGETRYDKKDYKNLSNSQTYAARIELIQTFPNAIIDILSYKGIDQGNEGSCSLVALIHVILLSNSDKKILTLSNSEIRRKWKKYWKPALTREPCSSSSSSSAQENDSSPDLASTIDMTRAGNMFKNDIIIEDILNYYPIRSEGNREQSFNTSFFIHNEMFLKKRYNIPNGEYNNMSQIYQNAYLIEKHIDHGQPIAINALEHCRVCVAYNDTHLLFADSWSTNYSESNSAGTDVNIAGFSIVDKWLVYVWMRDAVSVGKSNQMAKQNSSKNCQSGQGDVFYLEKNEQESSELIDLTETKKETTFETTKQVVSLCSSGVDEDDEEWEDIRPISEKSGGGSSGSSSEEEEEEWADIRPLSERIGGCQ
jgi:hypothetical protein